MVDVPIRETALTIPKEISTGIYQWNWKEVEKFTSQSSTQHLTKRSRGIQHAVLYPIMNRIRPFDDVEIGVGLNANSVTLLVQQENDKDFYQCLACMETKDGIIIRCQTKASLNTVKAYLKSKHDAVLQQVAVHCTVKNKKMNVVSRKQHSFSGEMFVSTNIYIRVVRLIYTKELTKDVIEKQEELSFAMHIVNLKTKECYYITYGTMAKKQRFYHLIPTIRRFNWCQIYNSLKYYVDLLGNWT